jgi:hypothetical protein
MKATIQVGNNSFESQEGPLDDGRPPLLLDGPSKSLSSHPYSGMVTGDLIGVRDEGHTPLVLFPGQPGSAAVAARSVVDLHGYHVGKRVALMFDGADPAKPVVVGVLRDGDGWPLEQAPGRAEVQADGERLIVSAKRQLVLRCGKASITLTSEGKVIIKGTFLSSRASGVNRIKGGSVQIN